MLLKLLIVEDNQDLAIWLVRFFATRDIMAEIASDGIQGCYKALTQNYDAVLLDINLPGKDGLQICQELREKWKTTPIIMLTSRSSKSDIITGLDQGADDYLVKPFDYDILVARLEALTRRDLKNKSTKQLSYQNYILDIEKRSLTHQGNPIHLSKLEFDLLKYFLQNHDRVISRQELCEKVWWEFDSDTLSSKTVEVYIGYLRKKLTSNLIQTKKWAWYILTDNSHE